MYLLLMDNNLITSSELKEIIEQAPADTDIINCFSEDTLLKVADKIAPDFVIIDFDLVKGNLAGLFNSLRAKSKSAYVMALINSEHYESLFDAIEMGGIDDYMVKPIQKEDLSARIRIAASKMGKTGPVDQKTLSSAEAKEGGIEEQEDYSSVKGRFEDLEPEAEAKTFDEASFTEEDEEFGPSQDLGSADDPDTGKDEQRQDETSSDEFADSKPLTEDSEPDMFDLQPGRSEESEKPDEEEDLFADPDLFSDQNEEEQPETAGEPESGPGFDFDEITPAGEEQSGEDELFDEEPPQGTEALGSALFDDTEKADQDTDLKDDSSAEEDQEDMLKLFDDVDNTFDTEEEEVKEGSGPDQEQEPFLEDEPFHDQEKPDSEPAPDVVRPADEFLGKTNPRDRGKPAHPLAEDKQFFDDLFDDEPETGAAAKEEQAGSADHDAGARPQHQEHRDSYQADLPDFDEDDFDDDDGEESSAGDPQANREEIRRRTDLPGKSADEFLFGEDKDDRDPEAPDHGESDHKSDMAEPFEEEQEDRDRSKKKKKSKGKFKGFLSIFGNVVFVILLLVITGLSFFLIQSRITGGVPQVAGYQMYIVLSGSMSPEFDTGSLVFVREKAPEQLVVGDIITFSSPNNPDSLTTHRIVEVQREDGLRFITRGDANNVNDPNPVPADNVVGLVTGDMPYVGYLLNFVQTPQGLVLLIFVPGVLIILFELNKIVKYLTQGNNGKKNNRENDHGRLAEEES